MRVCRTDVRTARPHVGQCVCVYVCVSVCVCSESRREGVNLLRPWLCPVSLCPPYVPMCSLCAAYVERLT